jgi:hypothetical protein
MKGKKPARKFGGRPVEREPELGKRTHLSLAVPLPLKRKLEQEAVKRGCSVSNEATRRLEQSFEWEGVESELSSLKESVNTALKLVHDLAAERALQTGKE